MAYSTEKPMITGSKHYTSHWGRADQQAIYANGIVQYWTPSHGGFELSPERMLQMDAKYRACSFTGDFAFEEDCSWCAVPLAFPEYFDADMLEAAQRTYDSMYAGRHAAA